MKSSESLSPFSAPVLPVLASGAAEAVDPVAAWDRVKRRLRAE